MAEFLVLFCIAALSGMGVGGGGLLILYLILAKNTPQLQAQGINLWFFLLCAASSLLLHCRYRRPELRVWAILSGAGIAGSLMGSALTGVLPLQWVRRIFGGMLILSGIVVLSQAMRDARQKPSADADRPTREK